MTQHVPSYARGTHKDWWATCSCGWTQHILSYTDEGLNERAAKHAHIAHLNSLTEKRGRHERR